MERDELETFLILAEELHFGRTADRMRLSRSRVSQLVNRLERHVGAPLFVRTSRRVGLTAIGRQLRDDVAPLHLALAAAVERARSTARGIDAVLHVGFSTPLTGEIVLRAAEMLRSAHPELAVEICEVPLADPYGQLRNGQFDVQVAELPVREIDLAHGPVLLREGRTLAIASDHPLAAHAAVVFEDLADLPLLTIAGELPDHVREFHAPTRTPGGRAIGRGPSVTNMQEALMMVAAGRGALLSPAHASAYFARPGVTYVPFLDAEPVDYGLVWRSEENTEAMRVFAQAIRNAAREGAGAPASGGGTTGRGPGRDEHGAGHGHARPSDRGRRTGTDDAGERVTDQGGGVPEGVAPAEVAVARHRSSAKAPETFPWGSRCSCRRRPTRRAGGAGHIVVRAATPVSPIARP
ncbi:LysR family transcriptional regulator [Embleya sp. NBC_00888]|uniref:LysR family transcriptional regulator n=1 Tax=Embleya sp. NBC_00888 TaxID=2975960 RepID=UPI003870D171|nr:LysR family transcriptional regulator [Embleya sp. NBC_00888]